LLTIINERTGKRV